MSEVQEKLLKLVERICVRPGIYIGGSDFLALINFLDGYITGIAEHTKMEKHPFGGLVILMEKAHGFRNSGWSWARHYLHDKKTDEQAIKDFPEFLRNAFAVSDAEIEAIWKARRDLSHTPPASPQTSRYER